MNVRWSIKHRQTFFIIPETKSRVSYSTLSHMVQLKTFKVILDFSMRIKYIFQVPKRDHFIKTKSTNN